MRVCQIYYRDAILSSKKWSLVGMVAISPSWLTSESSVYHRSQSIRRIFTESQVTLHKPHTLQIQLIHDHFREIVY